MQPTFTKDAKIKTCKFTVAEVRQLDNTMGVLTLLAKFDVGPALNSLNWLRKLRKLLDDKNTISFVNADGMIQPSLFETGVSDAEMCVPEPIGDLEDPPITADNVEAALKASDDENNDDLQSEADRNSVSDLNAALDIDDEQDDSGEGDFGALQPDSFEAPDNEGLDASELEEVADQQDAEETEDAVEQESF